MGLNAITSSFSSVSNYIPSTWVPKWNQDQRHLAKKVAKTVKYGSYLFLSNMVLNLPSIIRADKIDDIISKQADMKSKEDLIETITIIAGIITVVGCIITCAGTIVAINKYCCDNNNTTTDHLHEHMKRTERNTRTLINMQQSITL